MANIPHPVTAVMLSEQRHADILAESAREQRARLAERGNITLSRRSLLPLSAALTFVVTLALLVVASVAMAASIGVSLP